jgi:hypothetical protein
MASPAPSALGTRLRGRWLWLMRLAWVAATTLALCLFVASVAAKFGAFDKLNPAAIPEGWTMEALDIRRSRIL